MNYGRAKRTSVAAVGENACEKILNSLSRTGPSCVLFLLSLRKNNYLLSLLLSLRLASAKMPAQTASSRDAKGASKRRRTFEIEDELSKFAISVDRTGQNTFKSVNKEFECLRFLLAYFMAN